MTDPDPAEPDDDDLTDDDEQEDYANGWPPRA